MSSLLKFEIRIGYTIFLLDLGEVISSAMEF